MLMRTDPFRELDRLAQQLIGQNGTWSRPAVMPMDAYRHGEQFVVHFDLPGVDCQDVELQVAERPCGVFSRQLSLGETLDADRVEASYDAGVLTLRIPIAEKAEPRKIEVTGGDTPRETHA
jgi:HSP20 family protein